MTIMARRYGVVFIFCALAQHLVAQPKDTKGDQKTDQGTICRLTVAQLITPLADLKTKTIHGLEGRVDKLREKIVEARMSPNPRHIAITGQKGVGKTSTVDAFQQSLQSNDPANSHPQLTNIVLARLNWEPLVTDSSLELNVKLSQAKEGQEAPLTNLQQLEARVNELQKDGKQLVLHIPNADSIFGVLNEDTSTEANRMNKVAASPAVKELAEWLFRMMESKKITVVAEFNNTTDVKSAGKASRMLIEHRIKPMEISEEQEALEGYIRKFELEGQVFSPDALTSAIQMGRQFFSDTEGVPLSSMNLLDRAVARASLSNNIETVPEIETLSRQISRIEKTLRGFNSEALASKSAAEIKKELEELQKRREVLRAAWTKQKPLMDEIRKLQTQIKEVEDRLTAASPLSAEEKARLMRSRLPELRSQLEQSLKKFKEAKGDDPALFVPVIDGAYVDQIAKDLVAEIREAQNEDVDGKPWEIVEKPSITMDRVIGMKEPKQELRRVLDSIQYSDIAEVVMDGETGNTILLYGPPGNGKTLIAKAAANDLNAPIMILNTDKIFSKWQGESEQNIREFFKEVRRRSEEGLVFVFMDEVDSIAKDRSQAIGGSDSATKVLNIILQEIQGFQGKMDNVVILAATNKPWDLDSAFTRAGRFDTKIYIGPPQNVEERVQIMELAFKKQKHLLPDNYQEVFRDLASKMDGWSGAEIADGFVKTVKRRLFDQAVADRKAGKTSKGEILPITAELLYEVHKDLSRTYPEVSDIEIKQFEKFANRRAEKEEKLQNAPPGSLTGESGQ